MLLGCGLDGLRLRSVDVSAAEGAGLCALGGVGVVMGAVGEGICCRGCGVACRGRRMG